MTFGGTLRTLAARLFPEGQFVARGFRRVFAGAALLALVLVLPTGCGPRVTRVEQGIREQVLHVGNGTEPAELDPHLVTGIPEHHIIEALLEGLVSPDPRDLSPRPGAAERWEISPDGLVYTFHLRKNGKWSNGELFVAQDVVETYKRILTPTLASEYGYMLYPITNAEAYATGKLKDFAQVGVKALDPLTVQMTLSSSTPYFLSLLACHYSGWPVHVPTIRKYGPVHERGNKWTREGHFVGNGPFVLDTWKVNQLIVVRKNTNYWDADRVKLNAIYFHPIENNNSEERMFRTGLLHKSDTLPATKIEVYRREWPETLQAEPFLGTYFYRINVTKPPLNNPKLRRALAMAIDREAIVKNVTRGGQIPAFHLTPPGTAGYTARARITEDREAARKLLAEAGHPGGKGLPNIELLFNTQESHKAIAEAIQQMWKRELGIETRLVNQEWKVYLDSQHRLNYQICRAAWIGDYVDPNTFLDMFVTGGGNNDTGWSNAAYDQLIRDAARTSNPEARREIFQRAEEILTQEMPIIPIYFYTRVHLLHPSVKGYYPNVLDQHPLKYVYLESAARLPGAKTQRH